MSTRAIGHTKYSGGYRLLKEQIVTSGVSTVEFTFPSPVAWQNGMYEGQGYDVICMRLYSVRPASTHVWLQMGLSGNTQGGYTVGSCFHQIVASDRNNGKWWQGGWQNGTAQGWSGHRDNVQHTSTDSDVLKLAGTGVSGVSSSCAAGYINIFDAYNTNLTSTTSTNRYPTWWGEFFGDNDKLKSASANERSTQYWPSGYIANDSPLRRIRFNFSSGNINAGIFRMYGLKHKN